MAPRSPRVLHPRHGPHEPTVGTPALRPGSARRTSTVDMLRPDGLLGNLLVDARARDVYTGKDGRIQTRDETRLTAEIDYVGGATLRSLVGEPAEPRLAALVGAGVRGGFRGRVQEALPEQYEQATRLHLLLDDFPVATLVSGYAMGAGGIHPPSAALDRIAVADQCSGWRTGGTIMLGIQRDRLIPVVTGPVAPEVAAVRPTASVLGGEQIPAGADAWHDRPALSAHAVRRARRLDVWRDGGIRDGGIVEFDSLYRDSHVDAEGLETVIHEWTVRGQVDPDTLTILNLVATPRVLPWVECPSAAASADRLVGRDVRTLRPLVRAELRGISTCTHLNDQLRELADVPALL
jgi:hypothetical protein